MTWITSPKIWIGLLTLTVLEIVLGIDNIIFLSILAGKLPAAQQPRARRVGLVLAMLMRLALLASLAWVIRLTTPLLTVLGHGISGRDLILLAGGVFLIAKSTREIHDKLEGEERTGGGGGRGGEGGGGARAPVTFASVVGQIVLLDIVFSLDSVITAVGMARRLGVMVAAVVIAVGVMMVSATAISDFVHRHPTIKMLALSFLLLIGVSLIADGLGQHFPKGYIYFAMAFSVFVEMLNLRLRTAAAGGRGQGPVRLRETQP